MIHFSSPTFKTTPDYLNEASGRFLIRIVYQYILRGKHEILTVNSNNPCTFARTVNKAQTCRSYKSMCLNLQGKLYDRVTSQADPIDVLTLPR